MRISDWSSDVCSSDLTGVRCQSIASVPYGPAHQGADIFPMFTVGLVVDDEAGRQVSRNDVFLDRIDYGVDGETIAVGMGRYQPTCAGDCLFIFVGKFEPTDCVRKGVVEGKRGY